MKKKSNRMDRGDKIGLFLVLFIFACGMGIDLLNYFQYGR